MQSVVYEHHSINSSPLPFIFHTRVREKTHSSTNWHYNPEFLLCTDGNGSVHLDSRVVHFSKGDTVIINPNTLHTISSNTSVTYRCLIIDASFLEQNSIDLTKIRFDSILHDQKAQILMEKLESAYFDTQNKFYTAHVRACALEYLVYICQNYSRPFTDSKKAITSAKCSAAIKDAIEYIDLNFTKKLTLDYVSEKVGFSKYYFARTFKEATGHTLIEQINSKRCDFAIQLLIGTDESISQICSKCGFENQSYFSKTFREYTGLLPSAYRKQNAKNI